MHLSKPTNIQITNYKIQNVLVAGFQTMSSLRTISHLWNKQTFKKNAKKTGKIYKFIAQNSPYFISCTFKGL